MLYLPLHNPQAGKALSGYSSIKEWNERAMAAHALNHDDWVGKALRNLRLLGTVAMLAAVIVGALDLGENIQLWAAGIGAGAVLIWKALHHRA